ncbi:MAG: UvrD-helicase domain-containing protein [Acidimicrobiia bacterium]|nr:UvrD-helicase domain-containing protein [Acidimicrobiia bacterium]
MTSALSDQSVRDLICRDTLDRTLFVEAGAGTGKTTQLVRRVRSLVLEEGIDLADIAAITFTEAAATELANRIRVDFERIESENADQAEVARSRAAIADTDRAAITTLHGFAKRILTEHPIAAGLPPRIAVLDEVASQIAREERWERFVDSLHADSANEELLARAALVGVALEAAYAGQATLKDVAAELGQSWDRLEPYVHESLPELPAIDFTPFDTAVAGLGTIIDACTDTSDLLYRRITEVLLPSMEAVAGSADPHAKLYELARVTGWGPGQGGRKAAWSGELDTAKDRVKAVSAGAAQVVATTADEVLRILLHHIAGEIVRAAEERRAEGNLEFHDLLVLARRVLRTDPGVRNDMHRRFRRLLLDEFQDTDPIQIELAVLIASVIEGVAPDDWTAVEPEAGRLFFVGDPQQSIYRFRRADISLFLSARETFGPAVHLIENFRTVGPVLEWVNDLFGELMPAEVDKCQPAYQPLVAHRTPAADADHRPVLLGGPHAEVRAGELREMEAADVAAVAGLIRRRGSDWPVWDTDTGVWRDARLADVTILIPTRTSLPFLREQLDACEVPYRLDTGTLVYDTQEVRDVLSALGAVDDPSDRLALVAALRSPLYACSDVDLFTWYDAGGRWDLRRDAPAGIPATHAVAAAMAHLHALWRDRWWIGPADLLDRLLVERRAHLLAFGTERPREVWRRLRFLVDQARAFEEAGGSSLRGFIEWAVLQRAEGARVHEPLLPETDDDAVRILTVHGAKGLEFPITILSGMTTLPGRRRVGVGVLWAEDGRPEVRMRAGVTTSNYDPRADIEVEMDRHEKLRLLYVACTRARDHLVVACHHKAETDSYAQQVWEHGRLGVRTLADFAVTRDGDGDGKDPGRQLPDTAGIVCEDDDRDAWVAAREALLGPQRVPRFTSATAIADTGSAHVDLEGDASERETELGRRRGRVGAALGRAVHATLHMTDLTAPRTRSHIEAEAAHQAEREAVPEHTGTIMAMVMSALASDAVHLARTNPHHKETYVTAPVGVRVIEGYVDLLVETPAGLVVVDYKTDTVDSDTEVAARLAAYELQGAAYAVALEAATDLPVVECRFVFCRPEGAIERSIPDLDAAKARVRDTLAI